MSDLADQIFELEKTIVLTTHYMDEAEALSGNLVIINRGKIGGFGDPPERESGRDKEESTRG